MKIKDAYVYALTGIVGLKSYSFIMFFFSVYGINFPYGICSSYKKVVFWLSPSFKKKKRETMFLNSWNLVAPPLSQRVPGRPFLCYLWGFHTQPAARDGALITLT